MKLLLQKLADSLINQIKDAKTEKDLITLFKIGLYLDDFATRYFKLYLN